MAKPAPCQRCDQVPEAHFTVTNRGFIPWQYDQAVLNLCLNCFITTGAELGEAVAEAERLEAETPAEPILEQIEADEHLGDPEPAAPAARTKKSKQASAGANGQEVTEAAPTAHD
jgi:hypothetical protein